MLNKLSSLYVTGLDVLDNLDKVKICTKYKIGNEETSGVIPTLIDDFGKWQPTYDIIEGWKKNITEIDSFEKLPLNAQSIVRLIEKYTKVEVTYVDVNNDHEDGILRIVR